MEHASRRIIDIDVTRHPTAAWTTQQLREAVDTDAHQYLLRDRDSIFSEQVDESIRRLGLVVLKSPPRSPKANAHCERLIGTIRRECLDWLIPLSEVHLRKVLRTWSDHYNRARLHMSLGPGIPAPPLRRLSQSPLHAPDTRLMRHSWWQLALCSADCITNTSCNRLDPIFAEHNTLRVCFHSQTSL